MGIGDAMGKLGDLNKLRQQAMQMQKNLSAQTITVEENGVKVVITGDQKIVEISVQGIGNPVLNEVLNKDTEQPNFEDLISSVANFDGNGLNIINIWDLNVYQFYEQLQRGQMKEQYRWNLQQLLVGVNPDNIKLESYLKNIK